MADGTQKWKTHQARLQREHEQKMKVLEIMAKDHEMKYFMGVVLGGASGAIGKMLASTVGQEVETTEPSVESGLWGWILSPQAALGEEFGQLITGTTGATSGTGMFNFVPGILQLGGTGMAGFCASVLLLKAIFGDEDVASLLTGLGTAADAAMPL